LAVADSISRLMRPGTVEAKRHARASALGVADRASFASAKTGVRISERTSPDGGAGPKLVRHELDVERKAAKNVDRLGRSRRRQDVAEHLADLAGVALRHSNDVSVEPSGISRQREEG